MTVEVGGLIGAISLHSTPVFSINFIDQTPYVGKGEDVVDDHKAGDCVVTG